jgi:Concanavalin A-like lectin/glucanases superfamily/PEP-CTERM motif
MKRLSQSTGLIPRCVLVLTFVAFGAPTARAGLTTGLEAYYQFNGNGLDSSGNGLNLNLVGSPSFGPGLFGQALSLDNNPSQYATLSANPSAFNFGSSDFTIQVWVNFNTFDGREQTLIEKFTGANGPGWSLTTPSAGGTSNIVEFYGGGVGVVNSPTVSIPTGEWSQVIVERSGTTLSIYLDGSLLVSDTSFVGSITSVTNPLLIGTRDAQDGRDFAVDGKMDEIAIWNRALSTSEIVSLWNGGNGMIIAASVPEPSSVCLMGLGALGALFYARRRLRPGRSSRRSSSASIAPA